ncbi:MAG TPA: hypothetical protein VMV49_06220 [Candidatus Deferrimicrobium sp.]|nr:hypothetical protein [Candidatus Deferrimicrobium sp.]
MDETEETKPKLGLNEWVKTQYINNLTKMIVNLIILPIIVFYLVGTALNTQIIVIQGFLLIFIPCVPLIVLNDVIIDSRVAFIQGKWKIKESASQDELGQLKNHWLRVALVPMGVILNVIIALIIVLVFWISGITLFDPIWGPVIVSLVAFGLTMVTTTLWIKRNLSQELAPFASRLEGSRDQTPTSYSHYFLWEHILPWAIILALLNLGINLKGFSENAAVDGVIVPFDVAYSVWITALVIVVWMFISANSQVRPDVHLGRVKEGKPASKWVVIFILAITPFIAAILVILPAILLDIAELSIGLSTALVIIDVVITMILGRTLGIWWGKTSEFRKIRAQ